LISFKQLVGADCKDECTLVSNQGLFSQLSLPAGSNPQGSGEGRYDKSAKGGNGSIVLLNELPSTVAINHNRATESGWLFFGGILFVGLFVPPYAVVTTRESCCHDSDSHKSVEVAIFRGAQKKEKEICGLLEHSRALELNVFQLYGFATLSQQAMLEKMRRNSRTGELVDHQNVTPSPQRHDLRCR
jgi:hypothetical protein